MSALAIEWRCDGSPVDPRGLERVLRAGEHRGRDARGTWCDGQVGLGHALFRTTPESADERQPIVRSDLGLAVVADARIDNGQDVVAAARARGYAPHGPTDAERILLAYALWGDECADRLIGDFAFAVADLRGRRLLLARDFVGLRQLHYAATARGVVAATEPRQVAAHPDVGAEVNWPLLGDRLCLNWRNATETLYASVRRLEAGHVATVDHHGLHLRRYWVPERTAERQGSTDQRDTDRFVELFTESVRCRLRASTPVAVSLSGGLDSSSIACVSSDLVRRGAARAGSVETMSLVYPGRPEDERSFIDDVVSSTGLPATYVSYDAGACASADPNLAARFPDVPYEPGHFAQAVLAADALRSRGVRVVLEGVGGDEIFWPHASRVSDSVRAGRLLLAWHQARHVGRVMRTSRWRALRDYGVRPLTPRWSRAAGRRALRAAGINRYKTVRPWIADSFATSCDLEGRAAEDRRSAFAPRSRALGAYCDLLTRGYNVLVALPAMDSMDASLSIENRQPFLDRRLVEWSLALPDEVRAPEGRSKELLRRALADTLPVRVRERESKAVFDGLRREFLDRHGVTVDAILDRPALEEAGVLARGASRALCRASHEDEASEMLPLLTVLKLELWYRGFLAQASQGA